MNQVKDTVQLLLSHYSTVLSSTNMQFIIINHIIKETTVATLYREETCRNTKYH